MKVLSEHQHYKYLINWLNYEKCGLQVRFWVSVVWFFLIFLFFKINWIAGTSCALSFIFILAVAIDVGIKIHSHKSFEYITRFWYLKKGTFYVFTSLSSEEKHKIINLSTSPVLLIWKAPHIDDYHILKIKETKNTKLLFKLQFGVDL